MTLYGPTKPPKLIRGHSKHSSKRIEHEQHKNGLKINTKPLKLIRGHSKHSSKRIENEQQKNDFKKKLQNPPN
jgi:hypothetical protein